MLAPHAIDEQIARNGEHERPGPAWESLAARLHRRAYRLPDRRSAISALLRQLCRRNCIRSASSGRTSRMNHASSFGSGHDDPLAIASTVRRLVPASRPSPASFPLARARMAKPGSTIERRRVSGVFRKCLRQCSECARAMYGDRVSNGRQRPRFKRLAEFYSRPWGGDNTRKTQEKTVFRG